MKRNGSKSRSQKKVMSGLRETIRDKPAADSMWGLLHPPVILVLGQKLMPEEELGTSTSDGPG